MLIWPLPDLLHDVSLRSATNRMDAANLAMCFTPNLVSGSNITRDIQMCTIPHSSLAITSATVPSHDVPGKSGPQKMTLGMVIKACVEQYFEIFEEIPDRTNAMSSHPSVPFSSTLPSSTPSADSTLYDTPHDRNSLEGGYLDTPPQRRSSPTASPLSVRTTELFTKAEGSDSDPDESMLIMPIGPSPPPSSSRGAGFSSSPPSAWASPTSPTLTNILGDVGIGHPSSPLSNHNHRRKDSAPSAASPTPGSPQSAHESRRGTLRPARSMISIERRANGTGASGGSIRIGRGGANGTRRASGAGVEAIGITAAGFFSPFDAQAEATEMGTTGVGEQ